MFRNVRYFCQKKTSEYQENFKCMINFMKQLHEETLRTVEKNIASKSVRKHIDNGKLLIRDRIDRLIDRNAAFLEIGQLAAHFENDRKDESLQSGGLVCGIGPISGINCMIIGNDASVKGGTYYPITVKKHLRAQEIAIENRLPCIYLVDSGGANLWHQKDIFPDKNHFGRIFFNQAKMSTKNIDQLSIVMGSCTAGGAYIPAMSDQSIIVRDQGSIFLAGPPLVKASTGEIVDAENLGGARMHCSKSGLTDFLAENDLHAIEIARQLISQQFGYLSNDFDSFDYTAANCVENRSNDLYGLISSDLKKPFNLRVLVQSICTNYVEFKENYGETLICAFAKIGKHSVGLLANNGVLISESALKGCHFIQLCNQKQIPIVFFQNTTGFMVGEQSERNGIAKNGAKLIKAISCAKIPKITIITANSYGAGNFAMCGRGFSPNFLFMYPNAKISVMGDQQAGLVLGHLAEKKSSASAATIAHSSQLLTISEKIISEQSAFFSSANLWDDGLIDPNDTETVLSLCLDICKQKKYFANHESIDTNNNNFGVFRM